MRRVYIAALLCAVSASALRAQDATPRAETPDIAIPALPEVEVRLPADRTEFSLPLDILPPAAREIAAPALAMPELPEVVVAIPPSLSPPVSAAPGVPALAIAPDVVARKPMEQGLDTLPEPADINSLIAALPERAPAPVASQVQALPPLPASPPVPAVAMTPPSAPPAVLPATRGSIKDRLGDIAPKIFAASALPQTVTQAIREFYEARDGRALFTDAGIANLRGQGVLKVARGAEAHGLDSRRFARLVDFVATGTVEEKELALAALAVSYARDARGARLNPLNVSRLITATPTLPGAEAVLKGLDGTSDSVAVLEAWNPRHPGYQALKMRLASLRGGEVKDVAEAKLTFGPVVWVGKRDERVPLLRSMLGLPAGDDIYDKSLYEAVKAKQLEHALVPHGRLDRRTVAALGGVEDEARPASATADIIANMERWRWLPTDLGAAHVMVNIPSYQLEMKRDGRTVFETRVVVGKPNTPTPVFSHQMEYLVVNPYWNVPPSIALKEYLPLLQKNPYALQARGLEIVSRGRKVDPANVNWSAIGRSVAIRQPPGERNALGHIKFMFPNDHAVYLHDTPSRGLFSATRRAFSHGCVRVQNPFALASAVTGWNEGRLRGMVGGAERRLDMPDEVPVAVHLAYFTLEAREDGTMVQREDIYGHHRRTKQLLGL